MAKDPAMLWYWNDWNGGTLTFSRHLKGCYIDVLSAQFNSGPLSLEEIKTVLGSDFSAWGTIQKKFAQTSTGLFFNERLEAEKEKRKAFTESRRQNRRKKTYDTSHDEDMSDDMENENTNTVLPVLETCIKEKKWKTFPDENELNLELPEIKAGAVIKLFRITKKQDVTKEQVYDLWGVFKIQVFTGKKFYQDAGDVYSHFLNWTKTQNIYANSKHSGRDASPKLGTSAERVDSIRKWGIGTTGAGDTRA